MSINRLDIIKTFKYDFIVDNHKYCLSHPNEKCEIIKENVNNRDLSDYICQKLQNKKEVINYIVQNLKSLTSFRCALLK